MLNLNLNALEKTESDKLLAAFKMFQGSNKEDFLETITQNMERIYKEALCLRELIFSFSDSVSIYSEITSKIAKILEVKKCAIYTFDPIANIYLLESPLYGQSTASIKLSRIKSDTDEKEINAVIEKLFQSTQTRCIHLNVNNKITGILAVADKQDKSDFNGEDDYFLSVCARQISFVIENNRLYRQIQAQAARESIINRINNSIRSSLDLNTMLNTAANEIGSALKVSICNILKFAQNKELAIVTHEYNSNRHNSSISVGSIISTYDSEIFQQIFKTKQPVIINDTLTNPMIISNPATKYRIIDTIQAKSILSVPIIYENEIFGTISMNQCDRNRKWTREDIEVVQAVASQLAVAINQAAMMSKVKALATKDELTGLINRRNFYERFISEIERIRRHCRGLSFALFDVDHFKQFNDNYGHLAGDFVLKEIGKITAENIRKSDIASRYGGEEFAIILPDTSIEDGYELLERLRRKIEETEFVFQGQNLKVTISGGIIQINPAFDKDTNIDYIISETIDKADNLLYEAKGLGRNIICKD